jgi:1-acyl-sn-glycerol-3-phosphate acyltransferase
MYFFGYNRIDISPIDLENIRQSKSQIILAKHSSYIDLLLMSHLFPDAKFIASNYISRIPIIQKFGETKLIYLKNEFGGNLTDEIQAELDKGTKIVFFGEGVCSNPKFLLKLRNGAFVPKKNILPVHIDYGDNYWVMGEQDMVLHAFTQISNYRNRVKVRIIPDYQVTEEDKQGDIEVFKENFRKYYSNGFGISLSEKSYKDHPYFKLKL